MKYNKIPDFFPIDVINTLYMSSKSYFQDPQSLFHTNLNSWGNNIVRDSNPILIRSLKDIITDDLYLKIVNSFQKIEDKEPTSINLFYFTNRSYIPYIEESFRKFNIKRICTLLINAEGWKSCYQGNFLIESKQQPNSLIEEFISIHPHHNLLINQWDNPWFCTSPTSLEAPIMILLQAIWYNN